MVADEWAFTAEDVLWRRSKCGLMMSGPERERVAAYISSCSPNPQSPAQ